MFENGVLMIIFENGEKGSDEAGENYIMRKLMT
jgi:hypothetical protein